MGCGTPPRSLLAHRVSASPTVSSARGPAFHTARAVRAPVGARFDPIGVRHRAVVALAALNFFLMLRGGARQTKSQGTAVFASYRRTGPVSQSPTLPRKADPARGRRRGSHPCFGCGAFAISPCAQFSVQSVAGTPSEFQN